MKSPDRQRDHHDDGLRDALQALRVHDCLREAPRHVEARVMEGFRLRQRRRRAVRGAMAWSLMAAAAVAAFVLLAPRSQSPAPVVPAASPSYEPGGREPGVPGPVAVERPLPVPVRSPLPGNETAAMAPAIETQGETQRETRLERRMDAPLAPPSAPLPAARRAAATAPPTSPRGAKAAYYPPALQETATLTAAQLAAATALRERTLRSARPTPPAPAAGDTSDPETAGAQEVVTDFFPLMDVMPPMNRGQILRVTVPASSLRMVGFPVSPERWGQHIQADVLVGEEGMARAIRFVSYEK